MLLIVTVAAALVAVALTDRNRFGTAAKLKAASRKVDNSAAAVEVALKPLLPA